ncbi:Transcriptional activator protein acu-15 [Neolecta irregularis DAH-3]|uniref:Transcriptional activator protein acu-15 n=1 Tax=Neolecta irregularis (strain DAH-3) TaxID=1198029 RepID=A0A1U7LLJ6_NEOID|nr:Transcriptional activator protein acu-15 [Neolecta irregularis DAH-3]|eukprot:OLL23508.1 Transcriptional activator protein acu-15 [Neolecta irregularis DAH-3]
MFMDSVRHSALTVLGIDFHLSDWDPSSQVDGDFVYSGPDVEMNDFINRLPPIELAYFLSETYFSICNPLVGILHKPSHMREIRNMYTNPNYELKYPWLIQYHMVWALSRVMFQIEYVPESLKSAFRAINHRDLYTQVQPHFTKLLANTDLPCVQAASMMFTYLRGTVRPASYWHIGRSVTSMAYEIGLHRKSDKQSFSLLELELRKRNWWIIVAWDTIIAQQMGRPLSVRVADYDQEQPDGFEDEYLEDTSLPPFKNEQPTYAAACFFFRLTVVSNKIMERLYSVKKPDRTSYVNVVDEIERELDEYQDLVPQNLKFNMDARVENRILLCQQGLIRLSCLELKILVRHPSLFSNVTSPLFSAASLSICTEASRQLIHTQGLMLRYNVLDMSWNSASLCLLATMTILYSIWEKGDNLASNQDPALETEIRMSMDIMEKIGERWGVAQRFREMVSVLSSATLRRTQRKRPTKQTAETSVHSALRYSPRESFSYHPPVPSQQFCPWLPDQQPPTVHMLPSVSNSWYGWDTFVGEIGAAGIDSSVLHVPPAHYNQTLPVQDHNPNFQLPTNHNYYEH